MFDPILSIFAIFLYMLAGLLLFRRLQTPEARTTRPIRILIISTAAVLAHMAVLYGDMITEQGLNLGFSNMSSLSSWFVASLLILASFGRPTENLGILILPIAAATMFVELIMPTTHYLSANEPRGLGIHILFSILAYSLLGLAAVQAILLSVQERQLHSRQPGGVIRALPPMETMENLLFQMIIIGFSLQTMSLFSGFFYLEDMFAQHLVHKTILSGVAWSVFAVLLYGHWRYGWRGRTAVRWTLSGFATLLLAYFGSKYVLEIILER